MLITKELLLAKKVEAEAVRDKAVSELNAAIGYLNSVNHLLAVLELPEPVKAVPVAPPE